LTIKAFASKPSFKLCCGVGVVAPLSPDMPAEGVEVEIFGNPFESFSKTYSIVTRSDKIFDVPACLSNDIAGFIAAPFPIPGLPTSTMYRLGKSFHLTRSIQTCLFSVAAMQAEAHQK